MMNDRLVGDGCGICTILNALRLSAIEKGNSSALERVQELIGKHEAEHAQAALERDIAQAQANMAEPSLRRW